MFSHDLLLQYASAGVRDSLNLACIAKFLSINLWVVSKKTNLFFVNGSLPFSLTLCIDGLSLKITTDNPY